jgi:HEAT repeat protein
VDDLSEPDLLEMLASTAPSYRREAALGLRNRSEYSNQARDLLLKAAKSDDAAEVRGAALEALGERVKESPIGKLLMSVLDDEAASLIERTSALIGLSEQTGEPHIVKAMRRFSEQPETRAKALEAMWRSFDKQFSEVFPKYLKDPDPEVRRAAIWGIGYLGSGSYAGELAKLFEDEDFRADAIFAYSLNVPAEISHGRMPGLFKRINDAAGGLDYIEAELAQTALDQRLMMHGQEPYFSDLSGDATDDEVEEEEPVAQPVAAKVGRNDPCPCGSGKKYKKCHGG